MTASELYDFVPSTLKIAKSINGSNIVFVIDNSDAMPSNLDIIKAFTIELIDIFMCQINSYSFNVISFAEAYTKLSNVLLPFCKSTATLASDWIQTLNCDTSKNTLLALGTAYTDYDVDAVVMLTDGLMTQKSPELVKCVSELSQGRSLHIIYINEESEDEDTVNFLETLAVCTNGTLHTIKQRSRCVLEEEQVYPDEHADEMCYCSSDFSSSDESYEKVEEENEEDVEEEDKEMKLLGKVVLAKRNSNGYYYKGRIIKTTSSSDIVVVLFESSKDKSAQLQQTCLISELIFYDDAKEEKIYADDKVLVILDGKKRFVPATVIKKEYIFDDAIKDDVHFTKMLEVELLNGDTKTMPISSAIHIDTDCYERIVDGIKEKPPKKHQNSEEHEKEEEKEEAETLEDISKGLLRDKIERQLRESEEFLRSLHIKAKEEASLETKKSYSDSTLASCIGVSRYPKKCSAKRRNRYFYADESFGPPSSTPKPTSLYSSHGREKHCQFTEPHPPVSWNNSTRMKRSSCSNPRTMRRSASVGCNAVELSKKHWKGRPTTKESFPKRPFNERYIIKPKVGQPEAEEYQTADGVPFPTRTDHKLRRPKTAGSYLHHDIIGHRIVNPNRPNDILNSTETEKQEVREKKRITARRNQDKLRQEMEASAVEDRKKQFEARDEQVRKAIEDRIKDEVSKLHISIEKGDDIRRCKQHKQEEHRKFEREREGKNQERKYTRIAARREKMKNYVSLEEERAAEPEMRDQQVQTQHRLKSERRSEFERNRIEKSIEGHESKIKRLKDIRKNTEARFRSMRKDNDNHRDIKSHVRSQQEGITRAGILP